MWALGTWHSNEGDEGPPEKVVISAQDFPMRVKGDWDERWNTLLGSNLLPLLVPFPGTRTSMDDETSTGGIADATAGFWGPVIGEHLISGPSLAGGRRNRLIHRDRVHRVIQTIDYHQWGAIMISEGLQVDPPANRPACNEFTPIMARNLLRQRGYRLATTQEGLQKVHISEIAVQDWTDNACRVLSEVQRHLLEPVIDNGKTWQLWTEEEVQEVLHFRLNRFLIDTEITRKEYTTVASGKSVRKPTDLLRLRRVEWEYADRRKRPRGLTRIDLKQADQGYPGWEDTVGEPHSYVEEPSPKTLDVTFVPPPDDQGVVRIRYVPLVELNGECPKLPVPRMFSWALKWGIVADLLHKEGEANDPVRAKAAEEMYQLGVKLARALLGEENG